MAKKVSGVSFKSKGQVITPVFRGNFVNVFKKGKAMEEDGEGKYGVTAVFDPSKFTVDDKKRWEAMKALLTEVSVPAFGKPWDKMAPGIRRGFRDNAEKINADGTPMTGFVEGGVFTNLTSMFRPGIVDVNNVEITDPEDVYSGAYYRASVTSFSFNINGGKGVAFGLQNLRKVRDGEKIGGQHSEASEDFKDLGEEDLEEDDLA